MFARYFVPAALGLAPALLFALTFVPDGRWTAIQFYVRRWEIPIAAAEFFVVAVGLREGLLASVRRWRWSAPVLAAVIILFTVAVATAMMSPNPVSTGRTTLWVLHGLFGIAIAHLCGRNFEARDLIHAYLAGYAVLLFLFAVFLTQIPDWSDFNWITGLPAFGHIRHFGYYLAAIGALGIGLMGIAARRSEWAWAFAATLTATGIALWTGSRGAVLALCAGLVVSLLFAAAMRSVRAWGGALCSLALGAMLASLIPPAGHSMMGVTRTVEATASGDLTTGRTAMWQQAVDVIERRPAFGYGEGRMSEIAPFGGLVQPHNVLLQVALAWGLVGLLSVLALGVAFALHAIPAVRREGGILVPPFVGMAAIASFALYDGALYYALPISMFLALGGAIASRFSATNRAAARRSRHEKVPA